MYVSDFDQNGKLDQITTKNINGKDFPIHDFDEIVAQIPSIRSKVALYKDYSISSIDELFEGEAIKRSIVYQLDELRSGIFINHDGRFSFQPLPHKIQSSSMHALSLNDINEDGVLDIILGGNHYLYKPQFGRDDASRGWILLGKLNNGSYTIDEVFDLGIDGEIRKIENAGNNEYWIGVNNEALKKYKIKYEMSE